VTKIFFTKSSEKELKKIGTVDRKRVLDKLPKLTDGNSNLDIKKMVNASGFYRLRVGNVRIIFEIIKNREETEYVIRKIDYRGNIY